MKNTKRIINQLINNKKIGSNRRRSSAGRFCTSSAGAVTSLILVVIVAILAGMANISSMTGNVYAADGINLTVSSDSLALPITPTSSDGTFANSEDITIGVSFTGLGGYTLLIRSGNTNHPTELINSSDNTKIIDSLTEAVSESDFSSSSNYDNKWGYLPSKLNSVTNTNYQPSPSIEGNIIEKTNTDGDGSTTNYTISLGTRINMQTTPGDYTNTFVIVAVANNTCNPNAGSILEAYCMQDMNDAVARSMVVHKQYQLLDNRDGKLYYITKTKDNRVWMTQNLDLDLINDTESADYTALTSNNTDLNTYGTGAYVDGYTCSNTETTTNCTADGEVITWVPVNATTNTGWTSSNTVPYSYDNGDVYYYTDTEGTTTTYTSEADCNSAHDDGTCDHYHSGNYYNASAAIASNDSSSITSTVVADNSICPKGWRLPNNSTGYGDANQTWYAEGIITSIGTSNYRYDTYAANGYNNLSNAPLYMARSGFRNNNNSPRKVSESGYLMTGSVANGANIYIYQFTPVYLYPYTNNAMTDGATLNRNVQFPVRCLARQSSIGNVMIMYNANGGTGTMANQTINANSQAGLRANTFTREGYVFNGWNTASDGSGVHYNNSSTYYAAANTVSNNITLYAEWLPAHTITVNANENIRVSVDDGTNWTEAGGTTTIAAGEGQSVVLKAMDDTNGTVFNNWTKDSGVGDFMNTTWRNSSTKTTTFVVGNGDATIIANGTTTYTTIGTTTVNMQDITACPDWLTSGTVYQVTDTRDSDTYNVAKLADGKCWMLENMRLDPTDTNTATLTSANTNATGELLTSYEENVVAKTSGFTSYTVPMVNVAHIEDTASYGDGNGKVGVYYNYCAASAGEVCTNSENAPNATYDICPKGWRMPTGSWVDNTTGFGEYQELRNKYSSVADYKNALRAPLSGGFSSSTQYYLGTDGYFWSSSFYGGYNSYVLHVTATGAIPHDYYVRRYGFSMRCVLSD